MRSRLVLACAVLALTASACGSAGDLVSSSGPSTPSSPTTTQPGKKVTGKVDKRLPKVQGEVRVFTSPSKNIGCSIDEGGARCDIKEHAFKAPAKPKSCHASWGASLRVAASSASFLCISDTTLGSKTVLDYGTSTVVGSYGCTSAKTGVTCLNTDTQHGFVISRERAGTF